MSTQTRPSFGSLDTPSKTSFATCDIGPIDAVYTWVNGSDPEFVRALILERIKLSRKEKLDRKSELDRKEKFGTSKFEQKEDSQKKTRNENMSESIFDIMKKWTFRERCLQKTRRKEYFYIQTQLVYLECDTSEDSGENSERKIGENSGRNFDESSEPCSFDTIQNFVQKLNVTLLDFSFQVNSSVNFDSEKGKEEKKERERRSKKERRKKRFLLYSMEENSLNLGEFC